MIGLRGLPSIGVSLIEGFTASWCSYIKSRRKLVNLKMIEDNYLHIFGDAFQGRRPEEYLE